MCCKEGFWKRFYCIVGHRKKNTFSAIVDSMKDYDIVAGKIAETLYDESSKLWWNGPAYIAEMYLAESNNQKNN